MTATATAERVLRGSSVLARAGIGPVGNAAVALGLFAVMLAIIAARRARQARDRATSVSHTSDTAPDASRSGR